MLSCKHVVLHAEAHLELSIIVLRSYALDQQICSRSLQRTVPLFSSCPNAAAVVSIQLLRAVLDAWERHLFQT